MEWGLSVLLVLLYSIIIAWDGRWWLFFFCILSSSCLGLYSDDHEMSLGGILLFAVWEGCFGLGLLSEAIATA